MNWYKKAQLEQTLPYFQEFEDMGEYVPNVEDVHRKLRENFNTSIVKDIGKGDSGVAYELANGDVLKITTNSQEGQVANYFFANPNPHIVNYKAVWKEGDLYYIIMEKIETMVSSSSYLVEVFNYISELMRENHCYNPQCFYPILKKDNFLDLSIKQELLSYVSGLIDISVRTFDFLNINNIGIKDGKLIFFDIT